VTEMTTIKEMRLVDPDPAKAHSAAPQQTGMNALGNWLRNYAIIVLVGVLFLILTFIAPYFASARNIFNVLDQNAPLMLAAMGTTFVIIAGNFDLSSGKIVSICGVVGAKVTLLTGSPVIGVIVGILAGTPAGLVNGALVGAMKMNSFLATLATGLVFGGLALFVTSGYSFDLSASQEFRFLGSTRIGVVPLSVIASAATFVVLSILLDFTVFGRYVFAVGSNPEAARLSGLSVARVRLAVYAIGGLTAGFGGLILTTRTGVGNVYTEASTLTLNAIAAVVIGGTSIAGGYGAIWRTVFGVILLALTGNALNLLNIQPYWQETVSGLIIIVAVLANTAKSPRAVE
jgi:ribose transport system permease protein